MACPPSRIQIRRDAYATWVATNAVLQYGELGFGYPSDGYEESQPYGVLKIGSLGGSGWN